MEEPCEPAAARARWAAAADAGATGAVTSWGAGIGGRRHLRLYWEVDGDGAVPEGEDLAEENWTPYWRQSLSTAVVTPRVALVPAWEEGVPPVAFVLRFDPGMAFGAGDHPTTRLCLGVLDDLANRGGLPERALDVGTGTGVLALAVASMGASEVDALDIDPFGYAACRRNARLNGLEGRVRPLLRSLDLLDDTYPLVMANLVVGQLETLGPGLRERAEPGGLLLLSGFDEDAEGRVRDAVLRGAAVLDRRREEGWVALLARHPE
ncbi:MAG: 50S ribosomal protein L11 methyltransferase [Deltaproteobacteria bacterium]|nr:50S ribosomal protein L11 methyltransferase [Deltaproteobacteria bacterium]